MIWQRKLVYFKDRWEDFHLWWSAPEEVKFLRDLHRHEFHIKVTIDVNHSDRDVEFILMKRWFKSEVVPVLQKMPPSKSCEMMAELVIDKVKEKYNSKFIEVDISEDGENWAIISYHK